MTRLRDLLRYLFRRQGRVAVRQLAADLANRCYPLVWGSLGCQTVGMSPEMLRGYIRAYAIGVVGDEIHCLPMHGQFGPALESKVAAETIERLVDLVWAELSRRQSVGRRLASAA